MRNTSKEFETGLKVGRGSLVFTQRALNDSLGKWARVLPYIDDVDEATLNELELVASINYLLGKELELTPPLKARIARAFVKSGKKILVSDVEFMLGLRGGEGGQEERKE